MKTIQNTKTKFVRVKCPKCNNEQNIFSNVTTKVVCLVCEKEMNYNSFIRHRVSKKHNSNYMNYNQSQPIMIIQA